MASVQWYAVLCGLILARPPLSRTASYLALACLMTTLWAVAVVVFSDHPGSGAPGWLELARSAAPGMLFILGICTAARWPLEANSCRRFRPWDCSGSWWSAGSC